MNRTALSPGQPTSGDPDASLSTVRLSDFGLRREPPRPLDDRQPDYADVFDYDTLFYDVFRMGDGERVVCLGPPLLNCAESLAGAIFRLPGAPSPLAHEYRPPRTMLQPSCQFRLSGPGLAQAPCVIMELSGRSLEIPVSPSGRSRFHGRRVVTTLSKNNPLAWIGDWAKFNVRVHGADAIILYDNGSTAYSIADLRDCLAGIDGLAAALVVPWVFPYGPRVGPRNVQDSFFCQPGQIAHMRWRYGPGARAVLNADIDEVVVTSSGVSIFDRAERGGRAAMIFSGIWVEKAGGPSTPPIRHADCLFGRRSQWLWRRIGRFDRLLRTKWIAVPDLCDDDLEWGVHNIYPVSAAAKATEDTWKIWLRDVLYRHFRQITTGFEWRKAVRAYSPFRHVYDRELAAAFTKAFPRANVRSGAGKWLRGLLRKRSQG